MSPMTPTHHQKAIPNSLAMAQRDMAYIAYLNAVSQALQVRRFAREEERLLRLMREKPHATDALHSGASAPVVRKALQDVLFADWQQGNVNFEGEWPHSQDIQARIQSHPLGEMDFLVQNHFRDQLARQVAHLWQSPLTVKARATLLNLCTTPTGRDTLVRLINALAAPKGKARPVRQRKPQSLHPACTVPT